MGERGKETEQKFWDGHNFSDNCQWTPHRPYNLADKVHETISDFRRDRRGIIELYELTKLIEKGQIASTERFGNGKIFDPKEFLQGTFVRLSRDYRGNDKFLHWGGEIKTYNLYGVVLQQILRGLSYDVLICFETQRAQKGSLGVGPDRVFYGPFKMGEVMHFRESKTGGPGFQSLERVNSIEVLQYGIPLRKSQPTPSSSPTLLSEGLNP